MFAGLARDLRTILISVVTTSVVVGVPATAAVIAANADKVDGKHAVGAGASIANRKGKLVATNATTGRLPNNLIAKAPDADKLDGKNSTAFVVGSGGKNGASFTNINGCGNSVLVDYPVTVTTPSRVFATGFSTLYVTTPGPTPFFAVNLRDATGALVARSSLQVMPTPPSGNPRMGLAELLFSQDNSQPFTAAPGSYSLQLVGTNYGNCTGYAQHQVPRLTHLLVPAG